MNDQVHDVVVLVVAAIAWATWYTLSLWETIGVLIIVHAVSPQRKPLEIKEKTQRSRERAKQKRQREAYWRVRAFSGQWRAFFCSAAYGLSAPFLLKNPNSAFWIFVLLVFVSVTAAVTVYTSITAAYSPPTGWNREGMVQRLLFSWTFATSISIGAYLVILRCASSTPPPVDALAGAAMAWSALGVAVPIGKAVWDAINSGGNTLLVRPFTFEEVRGIKKRQE